jgi:hypothetical protein
MIFSRLSSRYRANWALLKAETDALGREIEQWSHKALNRPPEEHPPIERTVAGYPTRFQIGCYETRKNGDLAISIDAQGGPPTFLGVKPSYHFYKRPDGSVYY